MSALNADRALEALQRLLQLDQEFRAVLTRTVQARGRELDRCEAQLTELDPRLRSAREELTRTLLTLRDGYRGRVTVPVVIQKTDSGLVGTLACGSAGGPTAQGGSADEITRLLQTMVDGVTVS